MAGISSKAAGGIENKKKYNGIEFDNDLDLNNYEAYFRNLDPQTGRWWEIDREIENDQENISPYTSMYDDPVLKSDFLGNVPQDCHCCPEAVAIYQQAEEIAANDGPVVGEPVILGGLIVAAVYSIGEYVSENPVPAGPGGVKIINNSFAWDPTYANSLRSSATKPDVKTAPTTPAATVAKPVTTESLTNPLGFKVQLPTTVQTQKKGPKDLVAEAKEQQAKAAADAKKAAEKKT